MSTSAGLDATSDNPSPPPPDPDTSAGDITRRFAEAVQFAGAPPGTPSPTRRSIGIFTVEGVFSSTYAILVAGSYLTGFALLLGMNDFELGILFATPMLATVMGLAGTWLSEKLGSRQKLVVGAGAIARTLWLPMMLLPFLGLEKRTMIATFLVLYVASSLFAGLGTTVLQSWMGEVVPDSLRGRFFGRRNLLINLASIIAMLVGGFLLDYLESIGHERNGYLILFSIALVCGWMGTRAISRQAEPRKQLVSHGGFLQKVRRPLQDIEFRKFTAGLGVLHFGLGVSAPFFTAYMLKDLHVSYAQVGMFSITSLAIGMIFHPVWGAVTDRAGVRPAMLFNLTIIGIIPLLYLPSITYGIASVWLGWILVGMCWSGFSIGVTSLSYTLSPTNEREYYLAVLSIVQGMTFFLGSTLSGWVAQQIEHFRVTFLTMEIVHYHLMFATSAMFRFAAVFMFRRVKDVRSRGLKATLFEASENLYSKVMSIPLAVRFAVKRRAP